MMDLMKRTKSRTGQTALIVILIVIVGLTVAVAVLSRSITSVSISTQEEERARSFSAAEAGVEDALRRDLGSYIGGGGAGQSFSFGSDSAVSYTVGRSANLSSQVSPGQVVTIEWGTGVHPAQSVDISWTGSCADLVETRIDTDGSVVHDVVLNSPANNRQPLTPNRGVSRLRFVGCPTTVTLSAPIGTELSFYDVDATGTSGQASSRVKVIRSEPAAIGLLDYAIFSGGSIN